MGAWEVEIWHSRRWERKNIYVDIDRGGKDTVSSRTLQRSGQVKRHKCDTAVGNVLDSRARLNKGKESGQD